MVLSKNPPLASSLVKVHCLDIPLLAVDFASAGDLLPSTTTPELGYQLQIPDVLEEKCTVISLNLHFKSLQFHLKLNSYQKVNRIP
jgi:hypothetical protein